jgi:hypothetical protein
LRLERVRTWPEGHTKPALRIRVEPHDQFPILTQLERRGQRHIRAGFTLTDHRTLRTNRDQTLEPRIQERGAVIHHWGAGVQDQHENTRDQPSHDARINPIHEMKFKTFSLEQVVRAGIATYQRSRPSTHRRVFDAHARRAARDGFRHARAQRQFDHPTDVHSHHGEVQARQRD